MSIHQQNAMTDVRHLTHEEASLVQDAALRWLRLRDVVCNEVRLPCGVATFIGFADTCPFFADAEPAGLLHVTG